MIPACEMRFMLDARCSVRDNHFLHAISAQEHGENGR
jgi:hypothetical protein